MTTAAEIAKRQAARFEDMVANPREVVGIPYGIDLLDRKVGGISYKRTVGGMKVGDNHLTVLIADSGVGKSSFGGQIARNVANWMKDEWPDREVRIVTLEMSGESFQDRMTASLSGVPLTRIQTGQFITKEQREAYHDTVAQLAELPINYIGTDEVRSLQELQKALTAVRDGKKCGWFLLDHFNIVPGSQKGDVNPTALLTEASDMLFRVCRAVAPGFVLTQMTKEASKRTDKHPTSNDIPYTKALYNGADVVLGLYRESRYTRMPIEQMPPVDLAELEILKNRDRGHVGLIELDFYTDRGIWMERVGQA